MGGERTSKMTSFIAFMVVLIYLAMRMHSKSDLSLRGGVQRDKGIPPLPTKSWFPRTRKTGKLYYKFENRKTIL